MEFRVLVIHNISLVCTCFLKDENHIIFIFLEKVFRYKGSLKNTVTHKMSDIKYTGESFLQQCSSKTGQMSQLQDESTSPSSRLHPAYSTGETGLSQRRTSANHRTDTVTLLLQFLKAQYCGSPVPGWTGLGREWSSVLTETRDRVSLA